MSVPRELICQVTPSDLETPEFKEFARNWTPEKLFWDAASCLKTFETSREHIASKAIKDPDGKWKGWYFAMKSGAATELLWIYVRPDLRGSGIARLLLEDLLAFCLKDRDTNSVFLEVRVSNAAAIKLYESSGFKKISRRSGYYSNGEDALVYQKDL